ncbi:MAG: glycerophosphodiester phosphodiesterase [Proteobacteria bacterium]|nr:glycerophosphodiester phosphodiesterase [Pseudomonadota bacterium]
MGGMSTPVTIIGHRGASGYVPEHTLTSYFLAVQQGADSIEPDLVMTRDGVLVARHENEIAATTDVAQRPQFAARRCVREVDGTLMEGWFTEDFTLAELKTLRVRERIPRLRPANARFDGQFSIATLEEILLLVRALEEIRALQARQLGAAPPARVGIVPEIKHSSHFAARGLAVEPPLVALLERYGYREAVDPVWLESFEVGNLKALARLTRLRRVQLIEATGAPRDLLAAGVACDYAQMLQPAGLAQIARYAQAVGPEKSLVIPRDASGALTRPTSLVADAHAAGLAVFPWTFRAENAFLPAQARTAGGEAQRGDLGLELRAFLACGIDGFFTDQPDLAVAVCQELRR